MMILLEVIIIVHQWRASVAQDFQAQSNSL